ncbi:MAG: META domain-containing protein [Tenuifilaceae bacterium]|nr:META domain-containing protein [Tenuifilaceae bacterium]
MKHTMITMLAVLLVSCGTGNKEKETDLNTIHKKWELSVLDGEQIAANSPIYIDLTEDTIVSGFTGCNRLIGSYAIENESQIKFSQLGTTLMACPELEMELESKVLELLNTADNFTIDNGKLMLNVGRRAPLATFYEMSDNEIVNKYWKLIKLEGDTVQMAANQEREQYFTLRSDGSISGFAGCNHFTGQYTLTEASGISINENLAISLKVCPDVDIDESAFLRVLLRTNNYTISNDTLCLNAGKDAPLAIFEAVYF